MAETYSAGIVTAYGAAVRGGYTGTYEEFCAEQHMELGMWIRNNWIYRPEVDDSIVQERYDKCYAMLTGTQPGEPMLDHPDEVSGRFLEIYYDHLKEFVAIKNEPILVRRKPVKCHHFGHKVLQPGGPAAVFDHRARPRSAGKPARGAAARPCLHTEHLR